MSRTMARIFAGVVAVALVWVAAYWWFDPRPSNKMSFGAGPSVLASAPQSPDEPAGVVDLEPVPVQPAEQLSAPTSKSSEEQESLPAHRVIPPPARPVVIVPPRFLEYTVKRGDTLSEIANAKLGSAKFADAIRRANPLKDLDRIKAGDVIRIPEDPTNIQGKPVPGSPAPTPPPTRQGEMLEYTVRNGDTLSGIAKEKYGDAAFKDLIYRANRDRLSSPNALKEGQKLRLPPRPAS